jgi:hypothetical protein
MNKSYFVDFSFAKTFLDDVALLDIKSKAI